MMNVLLKIIVFISFSGALQSQEIDQKDLLGRWNLENYEIANKLYQPSNEDKRDYLFFKNDGNVTSQSSEFKENSKWTFNTSTKTIHFINSKNENFKALNAKIIQLVNGKLVLSYQIKELQDILFHYKKS